MNLLSLTADASNSATAATSSAAGTQGAAGMIPTLVMLVLMFAVLYFFMIRPQKKKQKEENKMRNSIQPGDEIMTIGGFYGRVISVKDDSLVIESVVDRTKQKIVRSAVQQNFTVHDETDD